MSPTIASSSDLPKEKKQKLEGEADPPENKKKEDYTPPTVWEFDEANGGKFASINRPTAGAREQKELPKGKHPFQLYSLGTPNGQKVTIMLEELLEMGYKDAEYDAWLISIEKGDQFGSGFVDINPNSKIPALLDTTTNTKMFESGSILLQLSEKFDNAFCPSALRGEILNWLFWQMGSAPYLGGGFGHFYHYAPYPMKYPIDRFAMETKRQLDVLEKQLVANNNNNNKSGASGDDDLLYMVGDQYTLADIAIWPWYGRLVLGHLYGNAATFLNVDAEYPNVVQWANQIAQRPGVNRGGRVNKSWGKPGTNLAERHDASDFDSLEGIKPSPSSPSKL